MKIHLSRTKRAVLVKPMARQVPATTRLYLYVRAGGRCEFDGCNRYLLEHHLTKTEGNFAQMAHIWAFSERGPRGGRRPSEKAVHALSNLMLLCPECHKLVDDRSDEYPAQVLRKHKKAHEDRVFMLTETKPDRQTVAVVLTARVGGKAVSVSLPEMQRAVAPRYLGPRDVVTIDLTALPDESAERFWQTGAEAIRSRTRSLYEQRFESGPVRHVSVFALGPIPLLAYLGSSLSDKVPLTLYQRHRGSESWKWEGKGEVVSYEFRPLRRGSHAASVALLLSLSGRIRENDLPEEIDDRFTVYEITLDGVQPTPRFLNVEESLQAFRDVFLRAMRSIVTRHPGLDRLHLFPAIPAPVAVAVGRDLMPKRDPVIVVYDYDKRAGGFIPALEVNDHERE
ncbi:MAG TPA: SAVED domain-containing protein [Candidatus Acidoferrales bacterium]|nr:SAVED domain-containing protein [Candidatus Acidoferrales bacterium]